MFYLIKIQKEDGQVFYVQDFRRFMVKDKDGQNAKRYHYLYTSKKDKACRYNNQDARFIIDKLEEAIKDMEVQATISVVKTSKA